jgi:hypothetical protein
MPTVVKHTSRQTRGEQISVTASGSAAARRLQRQADFVTRGPRCCHEPER